MDYSRDNPASQLPFTIAQLGDASNQLRRLQTQRSNVNGREFTLISSSDAEFQVISQRIDDITRQLLDHLSSLDLSAQPSIETNQQLNRVFRISRHLDAMLLQVDSSSEANNARLDQLIGRINQLRDRIFSGNPVASPALSQLSAMQLASASIQISTNYEPVRSPIYSQLPTQINPKQKTTAADTLSKVCTNFPETVFDHTHAYAIIEALVTNGAEVEVQNHLYISFHPEILSILEEIGTSIERCEPLDATKKRQALTEILVFSSIQTSFDTNQIFRICPEKLPQILKEIQTNPALIEALTQPPLSLGLSHEISVFQKLLCISHLNFSPEHRIQVRNDPLVQAVLKNPSLKFFLIAGSVLVNQCFKESCVGTAYNQLLQSKCGSVAELLYTAREAVKILRVILENKTLEPELQKPAHSVLTGTPPTKKDHAESVLKRVEKALSDISQRIFAKVQEPQIPIKEIRKMLSNTSYIIQDLESVFDPIHPVITSTLPIVEYQSLSSIASSVATGVGQIIPSQPSSSSRGTTSYSAEYISKIGQNLFSCETLIPIGEGEAQLDLRSAIGNKLPIDSIWNLLFQHGGGVFRLTNKSMEKLIDKLIERPIGSGCGHAVALFAIYHQGEKAFLRKDPLGEEKIETLREVKEFIEKYDYLYILIQPGSKEPIT